MTRLPVLFTAHGSPMNALGTTPFAGRLREWGRAWPNPSAILCAAAAGGDGATFPITGFEHASLSLRCVRWG